MKISLSSEDVFKTSWRRLDQDDCIAFVIRLQKTSSRFLDQEKYIHLGHTSSRRLYNVFKTSSKRLQDVLPRRLQNVFKTSCKDVFKTFWRRIIKLNCLYEHVFKTSSRRDSHVFETYCKDDYQQKDLLGYTSDKFMVRVQNFQGWTLWIYRNF